jgi:hypothetical protein
MGCSANFGLRGFSEVRMQVAFWVSVRLRCGRLFAQASTDNGGEAFVVIDEQASHTQGMGLSLEELQAQRTELLPERLEMARRRRRRRSRTGITCVQAIGFILQDTLLRWNK